MHSCLTEYSEVLYKKGLLEEGRELGFEEGRELGFEEGRELGQKQEAIENAKNFFENAKKKSNHDIITKNPFANV